MAFLEDWSLRHGVIGNSAGIEPYLIASQSCLIFHANWHRKTSEKNEKRPKTGSKTGLRALFIETVFVGRQKLHRMEVEKVQLEQFPNMHVLAVAFLEN